MGPRTSNTIPQNTLEMKEENIFVDGLPPQYIIMPSWNWYPEWDTTKTTLVILIFPGNCRIWHLGKKLHMNLACKMCIAVFRISLLMAKLTFESWTEAHLHHTGFIMMRSFCFLLHAMSWLLYTSVTCACYLKLFAWQWSTGNGESICFWKIVSHLYIEASGTFYPCLTNVRNLKFFLK